MKGNMKTETTTTKRVQLKLVGLNGNAFAVVGAFKRAARDQGWTSDEIKSVTDKAFAGDYDHLLATIMNYTEEPDDAEE